MAIYTYVGNKDRASHASRVVFSTGKDMVIGEQVDLTAPEIAEVTKVLPVLDIRVGSIAATVDKTTFPPAVKYIRVGNGLVAVYT